MLDDSEIDIRAIFGVLRRQMRILIVTLLLVVGAAGLGVMVLKPIFAASALVLVDPSRKNLLEPETQLGNAASDNARIEGEVELMRSDNVLLKVIEEEGLLSDPGMGASMGLRGRIMALLGWGDATPPTDEALRAIVLNNLRAAISVQRRGVTYLLAVQARSEDPAKAARIANGVARVYIEEQVRAKVDNTLVSRDVLQERIVQARDAIITSEGAFDTFIDANIARIQEEAGNGSIGALRSQIEQLNGARTQMAALADSVAARLTERNWQAAADLLGSDPVMALERQRREIAGAIAAGAGASALTSDLRAQLVDVESRLETMATAELADLRGALIANQDQADMLRQHIRQAVIGSNLSAEVVTKIYELQQSAEMARRQYATLLSRVQDLDAQAALQIADSRIVSPALVPTQPAFPNTALILFLAGLSGLGLGVALAFIHDKFIGGFTSAQQIEAVLKRKIAAVLPRQGRLKNDAICHGDSVVQAPLSAFSEAIRRIRVALNASGLGNDDRDGTCPTIVVTSAFPGEGKTTIALALARSLALSGKRTLLIDADLRQPSIHTALGLEPSEGLLDYLLDDEHGINIATIMRRDPLTDLLVLVGARRSDVPTEQLLSEGAFLSLLKAAGSKFDAIIMDTPPLAPVVDGLYLAKYASAVLFVVKWASTPQAEVRQGLVALHDATNGACPIEIVLNQQDMPRASYKARYGDYYVEAG